VMVAAKPVSGAAITITSKTLRRRWLVTRPDPRELAIRSPT
jgi:hypothetical protein